MRSGGLPGVKWKAGLARVLVCGWMACGWAWGQERIPQPPPPPLPSGQPAVVMSGTNAMASAVGVSGMTNRIPLRGERQRPVEIPDPWRRVWIGALVFGVAALSGWAWWIWQRRARVMPVVEPPDPVEVARARIEEARGMMEDPRRYVAAVSDAVRHYLEDRFGLRAPEQTTEEFLAGLKRRPLLDVGHQVLLTDFLEQCDLVKFAGWRPGSGELMELEAVAVRFVEETAPRAMAGSGVGVGTVPAGVGEGTP
jgi:hypothetical protein